MLNFVKKKSGLQRKNRNYLRVIPDFPLSLPSLPEGSGLLIAPAGFCVKNEFRMPEYLLILFQNYLRLVNGPAVKTEKIRFFISGCKQESACRCFWDIIKTVESDDLYEKIRFRISAG